MKQRMHGRTAGLITLALALAFEAPPAWADAIYGASLDVSGGGLPLIGFAHEFIEFTPGTDTLAPISILVQNEVGTASATASVDNGALRAAASASGSVLEDGRVQSGHAIATALFTDTFLPSSPSLAAGSLVAVDFDWSLTYSMTGVDCTQRSDVYAYVQL